MTFFVEYHGFYFDQELLAASAGYVRDAFVLASFDKYSEYEHLERILYDAISSEPIEQIDDLDDATAADRMEKHERYRTEDYKPRAHEYRSEDIEPEE